MKQKIVLVLLFTLILVEFSLPFLMLCNNTTTRIEKVQIVESNNNVYAVVDANGDVWEFESDNHYFINEVLTVHFDTMGTDTIYDDEIISIKK